MPQTLGKSRGPAGCTLWNPSGSPHNATSLCSWRRGLPGNASFSKPTGVQPSWRKPKHGRSRAGHASPCARGNPNGASSTSTRLSNLRSMSSETCITWHGTSSISYRITLIMSDLRKLSTGCSQSQKTRGKPVNNGGAPFSTAPEEKSFLAVQISHLPNA